MAEQANKWRSSRELSHTPLATRLWELWRHNCWLQLAIPLFLVLGIFFCAQNFLIVGNYNPDEVGGEACQFPGLEARYESVEGNLVQIANVDEEWRMTGDNGLHL